MGFSQMICHLDIDILSMDYEVSLLGEIPLTRDSIYRQISNHAPVGFLPLVALIRNVRAPSVRNDKKAGLS
jgi:hypothetical protein